MNDPSITHILAEITSGKVGAEEELLPIIYGELRRVARAHMARERPGLTLQPTALVHEAYLRLLGGADTTWESRAHFYASAAEAMRRILIERARRYGREKHGGKLRRASFDGALAGEVLAGDGPRSAELLALDQALDRLEARDETMAKIVKLRFFAGLTVPETAEALALSPRSVNRHWTAARAWLADQMASQGEPAEEA